MNEQQRHRLRVLRAVHEGSMLLEALLKQLNHHLPGNVFNFQSFSTLTGRRPNIRWPDNPWKEKLYLQTPLSKTSPVIQVLENFISKTPHPMSSVILPHFNVGVIEIQHSALLQYWRTLIDIDGDEIICYLEERKEYIFIEKTEDVIVGQEDDGRQWMYQVVFSSTVLKSQLQ